MEKPPAVAITVVSRNYFHFAAALYESLQATNPNVPLVVYLIDEFPSDFQHPANTQSLVQGDVAGFRVVQVKSIGIENWSRMSFQYTPFELACAVKPFATKHAMENFGNKVLYCDADLAFENSALDIVGRLDSCNVLLTPHFVSIGTGNHSEVTAENAPGRDDEYSLIAQAGVFNAGFYAVKRADETLNFLNWWCDRCRYHCYVSPTAGIFVDQSWLNFAPSLFDGVCVDRSPQLNVAYWNLHRRGLRYDSHEGWVVGQAAEPVVFFHFSGLDLNAPEQLTKHRELVTYDPEPYSAAVNSYAKTVNANGPDSYTALGCQFDTFQDGQPISVLSREAFRGRAPELTGVDDPWDPRRQKSLRAQLSSLENRSIVARLPWHLEELDRANRELNRRVNELTHEPKKGLVKPLLRKILPKSNGRAAA